ncbi:hypothetical protein GCM10009804_04750 [Kribbella hippodromi]|uniref:Uncharacterized protein n=1 Tax=Kribbella hippodromi TaxID=434347 RepID=A0ABP4MW42_9ACTN
MRYAVLVPLGKLARDVVEPLVRDHQSGQAVRQLVVQLDVSYSEPLGAQHLAQLT